MSAISQANVYAQSGSVDGAKLADPQAGWGWRSRSFDFARALSNQKGGRKS